MDVLSKSECVERYLRERIANGAWSLGDRLASDSTISEELGVSPSTVGNVMARLAAEGVLMRRQRRGTSVAVSAGPGIVAVLSNVSNLTSPLGYYYREVIEQAQRRVAQAGYRVKLQTGYGLTTDEFAKSIHLFDRAVTRDLRGVLSTQEMGPLHRRLDRYAIPYVSIVPHRPGHGPCVVFDRRRLCHVGLKALRARGYRDTVVFWNEGPVVAESQQTGRELLAWLREVDADFPESRFIPVPFSGNGAEAYDVFGAAWKSQRPSAAFFIDDGLFDVATRAIADLGIRVPQELALLTMTNAGRPFHFRPPFARIEFNPALAVRMAWGILERLMDKRPVGAGVVFQKPRLRDVENLA